MTTTPPPPDPGAYRVGQVVDGHVLAEDGTWYRIAPPPGGPDAEPRPTALRWDAEAEVFQGSLQQVMRLAMRAVQSLGWTVIDANDTLGLLVFETGISWGSFSGVTVSLGLEEARAGGWRVNASGKQNVRGGQTFAIDFGEAQGKANQAVAKMVELAEQG